MRIRGGFVRGIVATIFAAALCLLVSTGSAGAAAWEQAFPVTPRAIDDLGAREATVLADGEGNFTYVWTQSNGPAGSSIFSKVVHANGSHGEPREIVVTEADSAPSNLVASMGPDGIAHLAFVKTIQTCCVYTSSLQTLTLDADGEPTAPPQTIETIPGVTGDYFSQVAIDTGSGNDTGIAYTFRDNVNQKTLLRVSNAPEGSAFSVPVTIAPDFVLTPAISMTSTGSAVVGWTYEVSGPFEYGMKARTVASDGSLGTEKVIVPQAPEVTDVPGSVIDGNNKVTFIFDRAVTNPGVFMRQMDPAGNVLGTDPVRISDPTSSNAATDPNQALDVADDGTVTVGWTQVNPDFTSDAWVRTISPTGTLGSPHSLAAPGEDMPAIAVSPAGNGVAVLGQFDQDNARDTIVAQSFGADGTPVGSKTTLDSTGAENDLVFPGRVAFAGNGDAAGLWGREIELQDDEDEFRGAIFDAAPPDLTAWIPFRATVGQEIVVGAQATDRSPIQYEWEFGDGGTANGAFAKHTYASPLSLVVEVTATDAAGNISSAESGIEILPAFVDPPLPPVAPDTSITGKPAKRSASKTATFRFISSLSGSKFECRADKSGWSDCRSPKKLRKLKPGKHTFRVRAIKGDLIDATPASYGWTVRKPKKK